VVTGRIHSIETFGAVDGPGLRYVVFAQGCNLRCQFCHNPDTWKLANGKEMTVQEIIDDLLDYLPFFQASGGGITVSGGEPLLQIDFLIALFKECKKHGIHTTIDSSGGPFNRRPKFMEKMQELLQYTDLILLDIKHIDSEKHKIITGLPNEHILDFARYLSDQNVPVWIRHVLVPTLSDFDEDLIRLAIFLNTLTNIQKIEVLPYHKLGVYKWENLGLAYKLINVDPPSAERVENAKRILQRALVLI
jgi:pyruvate formate lyase activating enzyme